MNKLVGVALVAVFAAAGVKAATISDVVANQGYPWNGKVNISYTVTGDIESEAAAKGKTVALTVQALDRETETKYVAESAALSGDTTLAAGTHEIVWDFNAQGITLVSSNVVFAVLAKVTGNITPTPTPSPDYVQLWENGPYWATCNVGASSPEEYGYYFWWGDTVGYTNNGSAWIAVDGSNSSISFSSSGTAAATYGKSIAELQSAGYIDATTNLVSTYDAATAHLGSPWRMPTDAEISALVSNCNTVWTNLNGVAGRLVTGKGDYSSKSIFLPAAGYGYDSSLRYAGSGGYSWSAAPYSGSTDGAWYLYFGSGTFFRYSYYRYYGQSVRPVRGFAE